MSKNTTASTGRRIYETATPDVFILEASSNEETSFQPGDTVITMEQQAIEQEQGQRWMDGVEEDGDKTHCDGSGLIIDNDGYQHCAWDCTNCVD